MTQRYISAINIADRRAAAILKKRAKKRPLGDIESKYGYTPPQPVLSCRTVDVDLSGTRTYRPKSSTDILQEQHQLIHQIYSKNRNIKSASQNQKDQNESDMNLRKFQHINIEVHGRPYTSLSQVSKSDSKKSLTSTKKQRPKTTGSSRPKKNEMRDSFMIIRVDKDVLDSARSSKQLTNEIHQLWLPENHDLNQGKYVRGQKKNDQRNTEQFNTWMTFGGNQDDEDHGLVDAFTGVNNQNEYYSIDGNVGNRVAATLKKGDKVRIGINGIVHTNRTQRIKKESIQPVSKEESELFGGDIDAFNDIVLENFDDLMAPKKKKADSTPLNWKDQVGKTDVKVVEPKGQVVSPRIANLCESHPVVFEKLVKSDERPKLAKGNTESSFKVKHRLQKQPESSSQSKYHQVKNIVIDTKSTKEDKDVDNMTLDDVLRNAIAHRNQYNAQSLHFQKDKFNTPNTETRIKSAKYSENGRDSRLSRNNSSKSRSANDVIHSSGTGNLLIPVMRSVPSTLPATIHPDDLSVSAPGARQSSPVNEMPRKAVSPNPRHSTSAKSRTSRISSAASNKYYQPPTDAQYIKFSSSIKNPKGDNSHTTNNKHTVGVRFAEDAEEESVLSSKQDLDIDSVGGLSDRSVGSRPMSPQRIPNGFSINIPTADMLSDRDSNLQSPYKRSDDSEVLTNRQQRDMNLRDEQINQITTMLAGTVVNSAK